MATRKEEKFLRFLHEKIFKMEAVRLDMQSKKDYADTEAGQAQIGRDMERNRSLIEQQKVLEEVILEYVEDDDNGKL